MIVFDMDGVLCRYRIERRLERLAEWSGRSPAEIRQAIWGSGFEAEADRGLLSAEEYLRGFGERLGYPLSASEWVEARRFAMEPDPEMLELARGLAGDGPVGMFTNNPLLLERQLAEIFPAVVEIFGRRAIVSASLGRAKPDPEAYRRLAVRLDCSPTEILYFDDRADFVTGARRAGLDAYQVRSAADVRAVLDRDAHRAARG
ncbi:MAG: HAD family phosphatase [Thermoanaerobaculia bacterium]|nr:HAD family phosphatase [Thermoanaerobaculia bacterium]